MARASKTTQEKPNSAEPAICGLIMPISEIDGMPAAHWSDVRQILEEAAQISGFRARMVSESDETSVIHKNIVQNLYTDEIAVCDVSGLNPNVMFELGMRLAFDKPTVVIKDDATRFSFDTSPIQHVAYRRDLRFQDVRKFMEELSNKISMTYKTSKSDPNYSPFVRSFGSFKLPEMPTETVGTGEYAVEQLKLLEKSVSRLSAKISALEAATSMSVANRVLDIPSQNAFAPGFINLPISMQSSFPTRNAFQDVDVGNSPTLPKKG